MPIGLSPPSALPPPAWPILTSLQPLPMGGAPEWGQSGGLVVRPGPWGGRDRPVRAREGGEGGTARDAATQHGVVQTAPVVPSCPAWTARTSGQSASGICVSGLATDRRGLAVQERQAAVNRRRLVHSRERLAVNRRRLAVNQQQ